MKPKDNIKVRNWNEMVGVKTKMKLLKIKNFMQIIRGNFKIEEV